MTEEKDIRGSVTAIARRDCSHDENAEIRARRTISNGGVRSIVRMIGKIVNS